MVAPRKFVGDVSRAVLVCISLLILDFYSVVATRKSSDKYKVASSTDPIHRSTIVSGFGSRHNPLICRAPTKLPLAGGTLDGHDATPLYIATNATTASPSTHLRIFLTTTNCTAFISATGDSVGGQPIPSQYSLNVSRICNFESANLDRLCNIWSPIEGIFGVYTLPSGFVIVWIVQSQSVYKAPAMDHQQQNASISPSWFEVKRISELHLTHIAFARSDSTSATLKLSRGLSLEERRQLNLLRKALKDHDWYFTKSDSMIIRDLTRNLQSCFLSGPLSRSQSCHIADSSNDYAVPVPSVSRNISAHCPRIESTKANKPESHFFWNEAILRPFFEAEASASSDIVLYKDLLEHIIPVTSAFCGVQANISFDNVGLNSRWKSLRYDQILISRRSRFRAGTRFTRRGADDTGAVANFVETEQILILWNHQNTTDCTHDIENKNIIGITSFVQTRGSIPLRWSSPTDVKTYRPRVRIGTDPIAQAQAFRNHIIDYASRYTLAHEDMMIRHPHALMLMVNLIDKKSDQGRLGRAMDSVLNALKDVYETKADLLAPWLTRSFVEHLWFDFHAEVKSGRWHRLVGLLEQVKPYLASQRYFYAEPRLFVHGNNDTTTENIIEIKKFQIGSIRTNCMDCLDRTNVVQSLFGRYVLFRQLAECKSFSMPFPFKLAFRKDPTTLPWRNGEVAHRLLWADNADAISRLYAGTAALKGDFTRTGKRTRKGALDDGLNSMQRYYLNNFVDADRQEGIDLLIGNELFSNVNEERECDSIADQNDKVQGISIYDAVRRVVVDEFQHTGKLHDDSDHVLIKVERSNKVGPLPRHLNLRWLPGDLQLQVRNLITFSDLSVDHKESLKVIDFRATSNVPWWVLPNTSASG
jgi:hypothetical protein